MALAIDSQEASNVAHGVISGGLSITWSFNNVAGTLLIVGVVGTNLTTTIALGVPTYNSVAMTLVPSSTATWDTGRSAAALYYLLNPATGSNTVSISYNGTATRGLMGAAISFTGNHATTPVGTGTTATGSSAAASRTVAGTTNGNFVVDVVGTGTLVGAATSPTVRSALLNQDNQTGGNNYGLGQQATAGGTVTAAWTVTSDLWGISAAEILAAAAGDNFYGQVWL